MLPITSNVPCYAPEEGGEHRSREHLVRSIQVGEGKVHLPETTYSGEKVTGSKETTQCMGDNTFNWK